eukprot:GEMP01043755.1.p1 GENE.GEMP01043755.1~~GEMP01043755.1.p1  ORF type:complete len:252 (+),score=34.85 GEMP01043755.1:110-757(+)
MLLSAFWASSSALTFLRSTRPTNDAVLVNSSDDTDTAKMQESAMGALGELEKKEGCECIVGPYKGKLECECCLLHESCSSHDGCVWEGHLNFHKRSLGTPCYSKYYPTVSDQEIRTATEKGEHPWGCLKDYSFGHTTVQHHCSYCKHMNGNYTDSCEDHIGCFWLPESLTTMSIVGNNCRNRHVVLSQSHDSAPEYAELVEKTTAVAKIHEARSA